MQFFYSVWLTSGDDDYEFTDEDIAAYDEPECYVSALEGLEGAALAGALELRQLKPRAPVPE